ncbi:unnamed protein product [Mycena citricolor]|uniref:Uncharacterized protein n=1 Tax=Mycena citricolor TaxID=2018698 RepID=A0AAD2HQP9_9AGAR|nr:unnamed protein product [Mycena citricolor]
MSRGIIVPTIVEEPPSPIIPLAPSTHGRSRHHDASGAGHLVQSTSGTSRRLKTDEAGHLDSAQLKKRRRFRFPGTSPDQEDSVTKVIREHAFSFFIQHGGNEEDWEESREQTVREEMLRRWKESEWGTALRGRAHGKKSAKQAAKTWIGGSFEVGDLVGVNILQEPTESVRDRISHLSSGRRPSQSFRTASHVVSVGDDFVTASEGATPSFYGTVGMNQVTMSLSHLGVETGEATRRTQSDSDVRPTLEEATALAKSDSHVPVLKKQRVHYAPDPSREAPAEPSPVPPSQVLERSPSEIPATSAEAMVAPAQRSSSWTDVTMRDRMLLRIGYSTHSLPPVFDESIGRLTQGVRYEQWSEYLVLWKDDSIRFYEPHGTTWIPGTKPYRLASVVSLKSTQTRLSVYSFVDMSFCLTCPPKAIRSRNKKARGLFHMTKEGTNIFICKVKSRSRAADWIWLVALVYLLICKGLLLTSLRRRLGGILPASLEIRSPNLDTRVKIELPSVESPEMFTRDNIVTLCQQALWRVKAWRELIEMQVSEGKELELAWRMGAQLDWIWLASDVVGDPRDCAVLYGLAMQQCSPPPYLEIRLGQHAAQHLLSKTGTRILEPPAIEGYLERISPRSQAKHLVYLVVHDGNLFSVPQSHANPPSPMGIGAAVNGPDALRQSEVLRGTSQIIHSTGVCDLRAVLAVRRAFQVAVPESHGLEVVDDHSFGAAVERTESEGEDEGGDEGIFAAQDKAHLRMKRSFELLLQNGHVIRFEAHSCRVALEWIERLRPLILYWRQRHRTDASDEMDLAQAYRPRLTPRRHVVMNDSELPPEPPVDPLAPLPALSNLYSWCVLEGCRPIIRGGRIYVRKGMYGQYKFVQLFLLPGNLVQFHIAPNSSLHLAMKHRINLADAYVCSGYFAALALPNDQYVPDATLPRRYNDGLETDDPDEDSLFMIWYHPHAVAADVARPSIDDEDDDEEDVAGEQGPGQKRSDTATSHIPSLSSKRKIAVFRCRNKLERDAWCWAINCEIEKLVRVQKTREDRLRNTGGDMK